MVDIGKNMRDKVGSLFIIILQVVFIVLYYVFARYADTADAKAAKEVDSQGFPPVATYYPVFQDINIMLITGLGFLLNFLKRFGYSSFGTNMLILVTMIQWSTLVHGFSDMIINQHTYFTMNIKTMYAAIFSSATVLISWCVVLGRTNILQLVIMGLFEVIMQRINEYLCLTYFQVTDIGGSMVIHVFAAYFGIAVSRILYIDDILKSKKEGTVYHSDIFACIGTAFLWAFWPSFNAAFANGDARERAILNTYYAMCASALGVFVANIIVDKHGKLDMAPVQNATLAGGVAVGATANLMIQPYGAILLGFFGGIISALGFKYGTPFLTFKLKLHDTCGAHNLHGMPGILAAVASAVAGAFATEQIYGASLYTTYFPARTPAMNTTALSDLTSRYPDATFIPQEGRTALVQGGYQMLALLLSLLISIGSGLLTGLFLRLPFFKPPVGDDLFDDSYMWNIPDDGYPLVNDDGVVSSSSEDA